ncbi:MAG: polyprenyl synthetase family protein [Planctomycetes bacterium]|nr:polyprenyl synthetase family protein [Planctomycetota bacterium]
MVVTVAPAAPASEQVRGAPPAGLAIPNPVRSAALSRPEHAALVAAGQTWSAGDLLEATTRCAGVLARAGVGPGDVVALAGPASAEWVVAFHALGWLGAAAAPLPTGGTPGELDEALDALAPARLVLCHGLPGPAKAALVARGGRFLTELEPGPAPAERAWPLDEVRAVVLTSGSTAAPRPVPLTTGQLLLSAFGSALRLGHDLEDRWLACLPLHHVGGLSILVRCALYGTTVVLHDRFDPRRVARTLDAGDAALVSLVPAMLERVLDARDARPFPAALRAVLLGGDACPPALLERCRALAVPVALTWGMTEAASQVATRRPGDLDPSGGVGAPLPFVRVTADAGDGGRLALRGPLVAGGALVTRDRGAVVRGVVHVHGRDEDVLKSGGETVSLREVEAVLRALPGVGDAAAVALPDARWGERPVALVAPARGAALEAHTLRDACRARLSPAKVPERVVLVAEVPRTPLGKLARPRALALARGEVTAPPPAPRPVEVTVEPAADVLASAPAAAGDVAEALGALGTAAARAGAPVAARLGALQAWLDDDLRALEAAIEPLARRADEDDLGARRAADHLLRQPGKRLRPLCLLLAARAGGRGLDAAVRDLGVACELVHAATLLHDDVIDEGTERRGAPAARVLFGNSASVLAGDALFTEALRLVGRTGVPGVLDELLAVIAEMIDAEALQLERRGRLDLSRAAYLRVIRGKTAALFRWALRAGGAAAGLPAAQVDALGEAGLSLGLAFQLTDDILDLAGDPQVTGKDALADLRQGKVTWPVILACERDPDLRRHVAAIAAAGEDEAAAAAPRVEALLAGVKATRALGATRTQAEAHAGAAKAALQALPPGPARAALEVIALAAVERVK